MKFRVVPLLLLCAFVLSPSVNAQLTGKNNWVNVRSKNLNLIGDASEKDIRAVATKLEQFRETFRLLFPNTRLSSPRQTNVVVFKNSSTYRPFKPKRADGKADEWIAGYFQASEDVNYITLSVERGGEDPYRVIFHEYVHYLLDTNFGRASVPAWFNEGLAEYYQTFRIEEDQKVYLGDLQNNHLRLLQQSKLIPLNEFFTVSNRAIHSGGNHSRSIFYAQAWALVHYLIQGKGGSNVDSLGRFVTLLIRDTDPQGAFKQAFGMDYAAMEKELKRYVEQRSFRGTLVTLSQKLTFDSEITAELLGEATANAYLGDLLYRLRDYPAAEKYLARSLELDPRSVIAQTSLGLVRMRERKFDEAKRLLESAIAADSRNHFAHYTYAYVLSRESMDEFGFVRSFPDADLRKMQTSLKRSIEINPEFAESYRLLAWINLVNAADLDESIAIIRKGMQIEPGNQDYAMLMARLLMRQEKFDEAGKLVQRIAANASEDRLKQEAEQMLDNVRQIESAKRQMEIQMTAMEARGMRRPTLIQREEISPEEAERLEQEREIRNLNHTIEKPREGERQIVGRIEKIRCVDGSVRYDVKNEDSSMVLTSPDFRSLKVAIFHSGTVDLEVGCNAGLAKELVVINYRPQDDKKLSTAGVLTALTFVPEFFRKMSESELAAPATYIIGGPPTDLEENERQIAEEQAEFEKSQRAAFEREQRDQIIQQITAALRKPEPGEVRGIGSLERLECPGRNMIAVAKLNGQEIRMLVPQQAGALRLATFVADMGGFEFGCNARFPGLKAVITYMPDSKSKGKTAGELKAVEFVPPSFELQ